MNDEEYEQLALFLQTTLEEHGLDDIAEFAHYQVEEEGERSVPTARELVIMMLRAMNRLFVTNDESVIVESLNRIGGLIDDGEQPNRAVLHFDQDLPALDLGEHQVLRGVPDIQDMRQQLTRLLRLIEEDQEQ